MSNKFLFLSAAMFNWVVAIVFTFFPALVYQYFIVGTEPQNYSAIILFSALVFTFGIGYFWASRDFPKNQQIIRLGVIGKIFMFVLGVIFFLKGSGTLLFVALAGGDLLYAGLFWNALKKLKS